MQRLLLVAACLGGCLVATPAVAEAATNAVAAGSTTPIQEPPAPGVATAQAISTVTGVAISPLLGVGAVGAWKYLHTPLEQRAQLPWYAQWWFWGPALVLVSLCFAKDVMGPAVPKVLKKPLDLAEMFENKLSALIVAGLFVPLMAMLFTSSADTSALWAGSGLAAFEPLLLLNFLTIPLALVMFAVVWMAAHAVNVLIVVSPFATLDAALKGLRLLVLASVAMISFASPFAGAIWSLFIVVIAYLMAGWAFRLTVFGWVFGWDLATLRCRRFRPQAEGNWMFTARAIEKNPVRTYGKLMRDEHGRLMFRFRRLLVLPAQTLEIPLGNFKVGRGLIYPEVMLVNGEEAQTWFSLPPRYRSHEEELARVYEFAGVEDVGLVKGFKAVWNWFKQIFGFGTETLAPRTAEPTAG